MSYEYNDSVIIIQGNSRIDCKLVEDSWKDCNIIWSTWENEKFNTNKKIIYNKYPTDFGINNLGLQKVSTYQGLLYAKKLGFKRAIKWRSDQYPTNSNFLLQLMKKDYVNLLYWHNHREGYYVDYFMEGDINDLLKIWSFDQYSNYPYPEYKITQQIINSKVNINCIGDYLTEENDIIWQGQNQIIKLSTCKKDNSFKSLNIENDKINSI